MGRMGLAARRWAAEEAAGPPSAHLVKVPPHAAQPRFKLGPLPPASLLVRRPLCQAVGRGELGGQDVVAPQLRRLRLQGQDGKEDRHAGRRWRAAMESRRHGSACPRCACTAACTGSAATAGRSGCQRLCLDQQDDRSSFFTRRRTGLRPTCPPAHAAAAQFHAPDRQGPLPGTLPPRAPAGAAPQP